MPLVRRRPTEGKAFGLAELRDKPIDILGMTDAELEAEVRGGTLRWLHEATFDSFDPEVEKALEGCLARLRAKR